MEKSMPEIKFDFNNMLSFNVTARHGVTARDLQKMAGRVEEAHDHLKRLVESPQSRMELGLEWTRLPFQDDTTVNRVQGLGEEIRQRYRNVVFLGIGGSYLGLKAAQDALLPAYYNEFEAAGGKRPRVYFEGNNLDPDTISVLLQNLNPAETCVVAISKSGETTENQGAL
jgi:glucose-6-phosphate isomerase